MKIHMITATALAGLALSACNQGVAPEVQDHMDRADIEQMLVNYYTHFGGEENEDFASYYTEDAVFDVNGIVSTGHEEIVALYNNADAEGEEEGEAPAEEVEAEAEGRFRMMATNIEVTIDGDSATASLLWTGVLNEDHYTAPTVTEQGREYDRFQRQEDGSWLISHRVVIADSGIPPFYGENFEPRPDFGVDDLNP